MKYLASILTACLVLASCQHLGGAKIGLEIDFTKTPPTFEQAQAWRDANRKKIKDQVLINGTPVERSKYPAVIRISVGGSGCTAAVIGRRTILTAAHCGKTGEMASFTTVSGRKFQAKLQRAPGYPDKDLDIALGVTSQDIDVEPLPVRLDRFEKKGMTVQLIGYGCTKPGGTGGNDGVLRAGYSKVIAGQGYDLVLEDKEGSGAALCYGDSGGPVLHTEDDRMSVIGVNSKGNIEDRSYTTRLTLEEANAFLKSSSAPICGIADCGSAPPQPKAFRFENDHVVIEGKVK